MEAIISSLSAKGFAVTAAVYLSAVAVYRLFLHPLAGFPGPKLAAVTRYYEAYHDVVRNGQYEAHIALMHEKYGPIVRISPHELHINDPVYYEKLFRHDGRWDKYQWNVSAQNAEGAIVFTVDHDLHKARRMPLNSFFSKARVAKHQDMIRAKLHKMCDRIADNAQQPIDLGAVVSAFQRDVSTDFILGKDYNNLGMEDFGVGMTLFTQGGGKIWRLTKHIRWYGPLMLAMPREFLIKYGGDENLANWLRYGISSETETRRLLKAAADPVMDDKTPRTIVHQIAESSLPPEEKVFKRVFADVATVTGASFETTASVLRLIVYHVWSNPLILGQLRAELAQAASESNSEQSLELRTLEQLPYLTAVLTEGMRMSPGLGTRLQRIAPGRELVYGKWRIPRGTPIGMTALQMHMDENVYPEPRRFVPERWLKPNARKNLDKVYAPFSRGSRNCLGMHLAWAELYLVVAEFAQRFDFDFQGLTDDHFEVESDQFIISTKGKAVLEASVSLYKGGSS
ncbi:cytochrome P450 [Stachybotrys elegans]|uniref:Cytochrome P450 n=1 Tax=Stachybotrys elegans TaxID=80388 RepID=A0A8K0SJU8_9HYPO|nr:cytochrome P450 [Stachybotrys elegans]